MNIAIYGFTNPHSLNRFRGVEDSVLILWQDQSAASPMAASVTLDDTVGKVECTTTENSIGFVIRRK